MKKEELIEKTEVFVKNILEKETTGHDWWHIHRVRNLALKICDIEGGNRFIIEMAALLHDVDDWKLAEDGVLSENSKKWLKSNSLENSSIDRILEVIEQVSFKGNGVKDETSSLEAKIVQDADRIDAIGAIGIARAFAYGGSKDRMLYDPDEKPKIFNSFKAYKNNKGSTVNHFYEKLLILKERINTSTGRKIAEKRHLVMEEFLAQFFNEWEAIL